MSTGTAATAAGTTFAPSLALSEFLDMVNGTDMYDSTAFAMGKLDKAEYLKVPFGLALQDEDETAVGNHSAMPLYSKAELAQVYVLNKETFGTDERAIKIALLRMLAVASGWYTGNYEVEEVPPVVDADLTMDADLETIKRFYPMASTLSVLLPLASEFVFRTMGHHYLTGLSSEYEAKYQRFFNACVEGALTSYLPPADLYHKALHWVSLKKALSVASDPANISWLPNSVIIRTTSAPAGTAIIATSEAVLRAMDGTGLMKSLEKSSGVKLDELFAVTASIVTNPGAYHTIPTAYKTPPVSGEAKTKFELAKAEAVKLAPVLQGFLDSLPNSSSLAGARALVKHADANPLLRKRAKAFFREVGVSKAENMDELFAGTKRSKSTKAEDVIDADE